MKWSVALIQTPEIFGKQLVALVWQIIDQKTPFEDYNEEGSLNTDPKSALQKWKHDFEKMYNIQASYGNDQESNLQGLGNIHENQSHSDASHFCGPITLGEVRQAVIHLKGK